MRSEAQKLRWANAGGKHLPDTIEKMRSKRAQQVTPFRNTRPEMAVKDILDKLAVKYIQHGRVLGLGHHQWDFKLADCMLLLEVDGCYWHGCKKCIPSERRSRGERQAKADALLNQAAVKAGWGVIRLWEHEIAEGALEDKLVTLSKQGIFESTSA